LLVLLDGTEAQELVGPLSRLPVAEVDLIVRALKASRGAGVDAERERRRRRRKNKGGTDDEKVAAVIGQLSRSLAGRAAGTLETLSLLKRHYDDGPAMLALAVAGARARGYSDADIGRTLGVTGSAVGERYGRRGSGPTPTTPDRLNAVEPQDRLEGWVRSGHAKCPAPPNGCGRYAEQWQGKGPAVLRHNPGCPVGLAEAERRRREEDEGSAT
jgi:hypothetical protein